MITKKIKMNKAFALLFVMVISSIILAIALGVTNIAYNEVKFSTSGKDTNDAFFAADTGSECALFSDPNNGIFPNTVTCAGQSHIITTDEILVELSDSTGCFYTGPVSKFTILSLGSGNSCVNVWVEKGTNGGNNCTKIISKGESNCNPSANSVERELDVTY